MTPNAIFWIAAVIILCVLEGATMGLVCIWFALGAAIAFVAAIIGAPIWLQCIWFVLISALTLAFTRPFVRRYISTKKVSTNADRAIGMDGIVKEEIDNINGRGAVSVGGKLWTARTEAEEIIEPGSQVRVLRIEGVKLIVERIAEKTTVTAADEFFESP